jgi:hypothetical protein
MKLLKIVSAAVLLLGCSSLVPAQNNQPNGNGSAAAPQMVVDAPTHDFGEVETGKPLKWAFKIKNTGKADLIIQNVAPS